MKEFTLQVSSEIGTLRKVLIHSPDSGLGKVVPSKAQDWLFEDIIHLDTIRRKEYDYYVRLLMYFLDADKAEKLIHDGEDDERRFFKPGDAAFHKSENVVELEYLLTEILADESVKKKLVASVCAIENISYNIMLKLMDYAPVELVKVLISGLMPDGVMIFPPVPNLIFTRDIGIVINNYVLLNRPAKKARLREALLTKYVFFNHAYFKGYRNNILEIPEPEMHFLRPGESEDHQTTLEGGDVMVVSNNHVLIGVSERTSVWGATEAIKLLFNNNVVEKVTIVKIPNKRDFMHIDTVFTQVKRNVWVILGTIAKPAESNINDPAYYMAPQDGDTTEITQFTKGNISNPRKFDSIEALLDDVSRNDLGSKEETVFIYSGNKEFPYDAREQWTDSCNLLALKEGVVVGYDRNEKTVEAFKANGFNAIGVEEILQQFNNGVQPGSLENTLVLMPSAELSRARGGFHCMSMPLLRDTIRG